MTLMYIVALLALGAGSGFAAGLLGIGGGMIMVPFMTMLFSWQNMTPDLVVHAAIATAMASILFTSLSNIRAHNQRHAVDWKLAAQFTPGLLIGGLISGGTIFSAIKTGPLALAFTVFVGYSAIQMLRGKKPEPSRRMPGALGTSAVGAGAGLLSGLVGAGGAFVTIPFMTWCNITLPNAVGTSAALGFPIALASTAGYIWSGIAQGVNEPGMLGYVYWPGLLVIIASSIFTAPMGAAVAHRIPVRTLRRSFAFVLMALASYMLYKSYAAFTQ